MTARLVEDRALAIGFDRRAASWRPILGDADRAIVLEIVESIAQDLESRPRGDRGGAGQDLVLSDGEAGIAVFLAELPGHREEAMRRIARAVAGTAAGGMDASLHRGFSGIAWAWQRVHGGDLDGDPFEVLDEVLVALLASRDAEIAPGLVFGLAGMAICALARSSPGAAACIEAIVARLVATAETVDRGRGVRWWLPPPEGTAYVERFPGGFYDLGMDVGAAGIVAICARIAARGVAVVPAGALVARAARWMADQDTPAGAPSKIGVNGERVYAFGWGKGELGMAIAMLGAANATGDPTYLARAIVLGRRAALVDPARCAEPGLHAGAAGALHAFDRLYQATGVAEFREAAARWVARLFVLRYPGRGIGGFTTASGERRQGLLQGAAGIGLALLATTSERAPTWNRAIGGPD